MGEEGRDVYPLGVLRLSFLSCAGHQLEAAVLAAGLRGHCFVAPCSVGVYMGGRWGGGVGGWCAWVGGCWVCMCVCVCMGGWVGVVCMWGVHDSMCMDVWIG